MPVRLHHAVLSCVVTRGTLRTHLNERATQEMHRWLTVHLKLMRREIFLSLSAKAGFAEASIRS